ncbi:MAG: DUF1573 domain-containing protein [Deltaproteobacteria bacterium]|nr:DUF1573 domain-containing protein [Deltaproteobacteria bacterium]
MKFHFRRPRRVRLSYRTLIWSAISSLTLLPILLCHDTSAANQETPPPAPSLTAPATEPQAPRIVFQELLHDFGTLEQGDQVNHLFKFTNQGSRDLRIESVKTSCGCTAAVVSSEVTAPGQEGMISATFDTSKFFGERVKTVSVHSNDPLQPVTTLTLQGVIAVEVTIEPIQLYLGRVRRGANTTHTIELLHDTNKPISITDATVTSPLIRLRSEDLEKNGKKGKKLFVTLRKDAPLGRVSTDITVTTTSQKHPTLSIPVFGHIEGDMLVQPPQVSFGVVRKGDTKQQDIRIKSRSSKPVHIVRTQSSTSTVIAEVATVKDGEEYSLTLKVNPEGTAGQIRGEVQVFTDHPAEKVLSIPVYGMLSEPGAEKK